MKTWAMLAALLLIIYGLAGTSDIETGDDLTEGVNRAEVMAWATRR
jgi:hypothetical protein